MGFLAFCEFGLFAPQSAFGFGDLHAFPGTGTDEIGFEFGDHGQDIEEQPADRVGGIVYGSTNAQLHFPSGEIFNDVRGIPEGPSEPVELGND